MARLIALFFVLFHTGQIGAVACTPAISLSSSCGLLLSIHGEFFLRAAIDSTRTGTDTSRAGVQTPPGVPAVLGHLYEVRKDMHAVARELDRLKRRGLAPMGKAQDFDSLEGLYVAVLDPAAGMIALLRFQHEKFIDVVSGAEVQMTDHAGKRVIWIEVR